MGETHCIFNMYDSKILGLSGSANVNYADVAGSAHGFTLVLRLPRGCKAKFLNPFIVFKNRDRNYPSISLPAVIPGISYCTQPRGCMDKIAFSA